LFIVHYQLFFVTYIWRADAWRLRKNEKKVKKMVPGTVYPVKIFKNMV